MKFLILVLIAFSNFAITHINEVLELNIQSSINPATKDYLEKSLKSCHSNQMVLIKMNTPGGLVSTTKAIISLIGEENCPTAIWIGPQGASATSAGAIISSAAHFLFMSPGSNIGASTPIASQGEDIKKDARQKAINDLTALVRSLAKARKRNPKAFELMISEAKSFDTNQALEKRIIDGIVNSNEDIFRFISKNKTIFKNQKTIFKIDPDNVVIKKVEQTLGQKLLNHLANPSLAYLLFLIGITLIYFELQAPGGFITGSLGCIFLVIAAISFQVIPINLGALSLIVLALILFALEVYITSFGILSIAGLVSLVFGSLFLYRHEKSFIEINYVIIFSIAAIIVAIMLLLGTLIFKDLRNKNNKFFNEAIEEGVIIKFISSNENVFTYQVKSAGEIWQATSSKQYKEQEVVKLKKIKDQLSLEIINN